MMQMYHELFTEVDPCALFRAFGIINNISSQDERRRTATATPETLTL